jgi:hypothetical protein
MKKTVLTSVIIFLSAFVSSAVSQPYWFKDQQEPAASGVTIPASLTAVQQENLNVLCRVWGVVKYFHPKVANGERNADKALFAIMPEALNKGRNGFQRALCKWIDALGYIPRLPDNPVPEEFFMQNTMEWMKQPPIGYDLGERLRYIAANNYRQTNGYYLHRNPPGMGSNPDLSNEFRYKNVKGEDDGMRMLALFRYWNTIEYIYPSKYLTADNWDSVLLKFIPRFAAAEADKAYRMLCVELAATIHDTHANNISADSVFIQSIGAYTIPVWFADVQDSIVAFFYSYDSLKNNYPIQLGDRLIAVNGRNVQDLLQEVKPYITASNRSSFMNHAINRIKRSTQPDNVFTVVRGMDTLQLKIKSILSSSIIPASTRNHISATYPMYRMIGNDIGYINIGRIKADSLPAIFKALANTKGLIIDQRNYPSDVVMYALPQYIKPDASPFARFSRVDYTTPGRFIIGGNAESGSDYPDYYKGKIVILAYPLSQSQAEFTMMSFRTAPNAIIMGSQTSGADGNVTNIFLPGGMASYMSGLGVYHPDKKPTQGIGIVPDIVVKPTITGIRRGEDELLDAAIKYINTNEPKKN